MSTLRIETNPESNGLGFLSWDTEGGGMARTNLLRPDSTVHIEAWDGTEWGLAEGFAVRATERDGGFDLSVQSLSPSEAAAEPLRIVFPFLPRASATTVISSRFEAGGAMLLPAILSAPGFGQMLVTSSTTEVTTRLVGSRAEQLIDWLVELPGGVPTAEFKLQFRPLLLEAPEGFEDAQRWKLARRAWFNVWQVTAEWGDQNDPFHGPPGVLGNNVISDPVSACLNIYADSALLTPRLANGISVLPVVARTIDWFLDERTLESGQVISYWDYRCFLDSNPSILISAWDYVEGSGDEEWLRDRLQKLEKVADYLAARDIDGDGVVEAEISGDANSLHDPARSSNGYDTINFGHKDAYSNALIYRAWRCFADLEKRLGRDELARKYSELADKLKSVYFKTLFNQATGFVAGWISRDGVLHDYALPFLNYMAIDYGLVPREEGRAILGRLDELMRRQGFTRHDSGIPMALLPVRREDYLQGQEGFGIPQLEDGSDGFRQYCNGGISPADGFRFVAAHYAVGLEREADAKLDLMLARVGLDDMHDGGFAVSIVDEFPLGGEFLDWDGNPSGYEGMLSHAWYFIQAVAIREPKLRQRLYRPLLQIAADHRRDGEGAEISLEQDGQDFSG